MAAIKIEIGWPFLLGFYIYRRAMRVSGGHDVWDIQRE
jgi:hypothetical protein